MSTQPQQKEAQSRELGYFTEDGTDKKMYSLIVAAYNNRTQQAIDIIRADPRQINQQDPHSGLTALHIAIFRQNRELVEVLIKHPRTNVQIKDNFRRRAVDMLDYTADPEIFTWIMEATYSTEMRELEEFALGNGGDDDPDPPGNNSIVPFKPKP